MFQLVACGLPTCVSANQNHQDPKDNGHRLPRFFVRRRLQLISYEPLRPDGFQDVEWLGKQYAALEFAALRRLSVILERLRLFERPYEKLLS